MRVFAATAQTLNAGLLGAQLHAIEEDMAPFSDADIANDGFVCTCREDGLVHILDASDVQVRCGGCPLSEMGTALTLLPPGSRM